MTFKEQEQFTWQRCQRHLTALLKEWHEDCAHGRIYLKMDLLEGFEAKTTITVA